MFSIPEKENQNVKFKTSFNAEVIESLEGSVNAKDGGWKIVEGGESCR